MRSSRLLLSAAALVVSGTLIVGCTSSEAGTASPATTNGSNSNGGTPPSSDSSPSSVDIPPPPKDLSLDGIDPCTLFTDAQQGQLRINKLTPGDGGSSIYKGMKQCTLDAAAEEPIVTYDVVAVTNVDVDFWINNPSNADAKLISIGGYPAAEFHIKGSGKYDCAVAVGVAKNQHLHVEMLPLSDDITGEQICQGSEQAAAMALQTLQTMR